MRNILILFVCALIFLSGSKAQQFEHITKNDVSGKGITVLIFLKEECPICRIYAPTLQKIVQEFKQSSVQFYGVFPDKSPSKEIITSFLKEFSIPFPVCIDSTLELTQFAGATITPQVVLFDNSGIIRYSGRIDDWFIGIGKKRANPTIHNLRDALQALIYAQPVVINKTDAVGCYIPL